MRASHAVAAVLLALGAMLVIGSPSGIEGGTEVVLEIRASEVTSGKILADFRMHWSNGGAFVVKGVATLEDDMVAALGAALRP